MTTALRAYRRRGVTLLVTVLLAAGVTISTAGPAFADPSPVPTAPSGGGGAVTPGAAPPGSITWAVQPSTKDGPDQRSSFTYTNLAPGTVVNDYVGVTNYSDKAVTFEVYASDAFNTGSGTIDMLAAAQQPTDIGSWVAIPKKTLTIEPGARVNEPFTLTVPFNATPGDHVGGIIASVRADVTTAEKSVQIDRRLAVPIFLRVTGDIAPGIAVESVSASYAASLNPFAGGDVDVSFTIHNTGNERLDVAGAIVIKGLGITLGSADVAAVRNLLPGASYRGTQRITGVFALGPLNAEVQANPTEPAGLPASGQTPRPAASEAGFWATPWSLVILVALLVGLFFLIRWWLRRDRERSQRTVARAVAKARSDTVEQLTGSTEPGASAKIPAGDG